MKHVVWCTFIDPEFARLGRTEDDAVREKYGERIANGSVICTQSGYYAREFAHRTHGGMVGVNKMS